MKLLALNGGGTSGYISLLFLAQLEKDLGRPCSSVFDLICGVSAGSIGAVALGAGAPAAEAAIAFAKMVPSIFTKKHFWSGYFRTPMYDSNNLRISLGNVVGSLTMGSARTRVMVHATQLTGPRVGVRFFRSWDPVDQPLLMADLATASSSAPGYFKPYTLGNDVFCDGGVAANNPSMEALVQAKMIQGDLNHFCVNLMPNITTGMTHAAACNHHTMESWIADIASVCISGNSQVVEDQCDNLMGNRYVGVDFGVDLDIDAWAAADQAAMIKAANDYYAAFGPELVKQLAA